MAIILLLKESVEMLLAKPNLRITVTPFAVPQWRKESIVCLVTSLAGRHFKKKFFFNLYFVNPGVDAFEIRLSIKL